MNNNIMLDLETMGNNPNAAIVAIGAVRFSFEGLLDEFYVPVDLSSCVDAGLVMDASTVLWWMNQSDEARSYITQNGVPLSRALGEFSDWIGKNPIVWGCGADFDNVILSNAYHALSLPLPWKFYNNRCYRTLKSLNKHVKMNRVGTYHNAVDDAKSQALHLIDIFNQLEVKGDES